MNNWLAGMLVFFLWSYGAVAEESPVKESPVKEFPAREFPSGETVFAATFTGLDGKPVALADFKGKPLVLNFWATWCPPCLKEIPDLVEIHSRYAARGVALVGVAVEEAARVPEFVKTHNINYPIVTGRDKGIWLLQTLGNKAAGLPYTVVLDRSGNIVFTKRGAVTRERIEQVLDPLL